MAVVALTHALLADAATPATVTAFLTSDRSDQRVTAGSVRRYAGGRLRVVSQAGSAQTLGVTARYLTPAQVAFVDALRGRVVLFRDVMGRKVYGVFFTIAVKDYTDRGGQDVTFTLTEVTFSEAVD